MKAWFRRLPIDRKLVALAVLVSASALVIATLGLSLFDLWRYRASSLIDAEATARVLAENIGAAVAFKDPPAAGETLATVRVRRVVVRACAYLADGTLFTGYARSAAEPCPAAPPRADGWGLVTGVAPIVLNERELGRVFVVRDLSDLGGRLMLTALAGGLMLLVAAFTAYLVAERVHAAISRPITELAGAVRAFGRDPNAVVPPIEVAPDEVGELVASVREMAVRVRAASDELTRANVVLRDEIAERRRVEGEREAALVREREASRLKDEFLAAVSHELRTPLNAMMGWAHILEATQPSDETFRRASASILKNARAQARVIEDLIDVSRIVTGKLRLRLSSADVRAVTAAALESVQPTAAAKGVVIATDAPDEPCVVRADVDRLHQVLWNLLSNAVKFTPGGGHVRVSIGRSPGAVSVTVADTGIGMPAAFVPHVFERFRQADGSMTREHGGLGLGLAIVKELTEMHGGRVSASSDGPGRGAVFSLTLPEYVPADGVPAGETESPDPQPSLEGIRVLAVDDNEDAVAIISAALGAAGATVRTVTSAAEALATWLDNPPDVLICDLAMPQVSGLDLLRELRALDAARARLTPAIAVSAHTSEEYRRRSLDAGFQAYISKPFTTADLVKAVAQAAEQI